MASTSPPSVALTFHVHMPLPASASRSPTRGCGGGAAGSAASGINTAGFHGVTGGCGGRGGGGHPVGATGPTGGVVVGGTVGAVVAAGVAGEGRAPATCGLCDDDRWSAAAPAPVNSTTAQSAPIPLAAVFTWASFTAGAALLRSGPLRTAVTTDPLGRQHAPVLAAVADPH